MADLIHIPHDEVAKVWPWLQERVVYGVERSRGRMSVEGLYAKAESGEYDLHAVYQDDDEAGTQENGADRVLAVLFTQLFREMCGTQVCAIRFLGGKNRVEWTWLIEALELWAVKNGCDMMSFVTRRGLARELKDFDYRQAAVLLEKQLKPKAAENAGRQATNSGNATEHRPGCAKPVQSDLHASR